MILTLNHPDSEPVDPEHDLKALIVYEDFTSALHAEALLRRVGHRCGGDGLLIYSMWKFDVLKATTLCKMAAEEAAAANIIVIAAHERDTLPDAVLNWFSLWRHVKGARPKSLVAVLEPEEKQPDGEESSARKDDAGSQGRIYSFLEILARLDKLSFFATGFDDGSDLELKSTWSGAATGHAAIGDGQPAATGSIPDQLSAGQTGRPADTKLSEAIGDWVS